MKKISDFLSRHKYGIMNSVTTAIVTSNVMMAALADNTGNVSRIMSFIVRVIGALITALALFFAIMGLVHYAQANSEGDGPGKQKAVMQMAAGVMLLLLSIILMANASNIAGLISGIQVDAL